MNSRLREAREATARAAIKHETDWIKEHGGSLAGYIQRYGSVNDPDHYGDGGEAIYQADLGALRKAQENLAAIGGAA